MNQDELSTVFAVNTAQTEWVEYTVRIHRTRKIQKAWELNASLAWRSSNKVIAVAAVRGSYSTKLDAERVLFEVAEQNGRQIKRVTKKVVSHLEKTFNYPNGRSTYLLESAIV